MKELLSKVDMAAVHQVVELQARTIESQKAMLKETGDYNMQCHQEKWDVEGKLKEAKKELEYLRSENRKAAEKIMELETKLKFKKSFWQKLFGKEPK
jgi:predicted nuclease with TOPRIM domain